MTAKSDYVELVKTMLQADDPIIITPQIVRDAGGRDYFAASLGACNISLYPYRRKYVATRLEPVDAWFKLQKQKQ